MSPFNAFLVLSKVRLTKFDNPKDSKKLPFSNSFFSANTLIKSASICLSLI